MNVCITYLHLHTHTPLPWLIGLHIYIYIYIYTHTHIVFICSYLPLDMYITLIFNECFGQQNLMFSNYCSILYLFSHNSHLNYFVFANNTHFQMIISVYTISFAQPGFFSNKIFNFNFVMSKIWAIVFCIIDGGKLFKV